MKDKVLVSIITPTYNHEEFIEYMDWDALVSRDRFFLKEEVLSESPRIARNEWGAVKRYTEEITPIPVEAPIKSGKDLESYHQQLMKDLEANPDDDRVVSALIRHYQLKLEVMDQIITQLNQVKSEISETIATLKGSLVLPSFNLLFCLWLFKC